MLFKFDMLHGLKNKELELDKQVDKTVTFISFLYFVLMVEISYNSVMIFIVFCIRSIHYNISTVLTKK